MENTVVDFDNAFDPADMGFTPEANADVETEVNVDTDVKADVEPTSETDVKTDVETKENPYNFKVKVNPVEEDKEFSKEELIEAIQKKADYDNKYTRNKELESEIAELKQELEFFGLKDKDSLRQYRMETEVQNLVSEGMAEERARELVELKNADSIAKIRAKQEENTKAEDKEIADFLTENNLKADEVPAEVIEKWKNGEKLKYAYKDYENKQLKKELDTFKQNLSNEKKAVVTATTEHGITENQKTDPFTEGFFSR
jgi:hypothetical protein